MLCALVASLLEILSPSRVAMMLIVDVKWGEGEKARTEGVERSGGQYRGTDCINISSTDTTLLDHAYKSLFVNVFRKTKRNYI